jgi:hypothetical protein
VRGFDQEFRWYSRVKWCRTTKRKDLAPFAHPGPDENLPIAHRLAGSSSYNATLARTIYTFFTVSEKKFDVLPACKHGCMFVGALRFFENGPVTWTTTRPTDAHFTSSTSTVLEHLKVVGYGKGSPFMHLLPIALHLTLEARYLHCSGCYFEFKRLGFTAAYRARQCLLTSRNTFISILRAGLLQPHGSESCTWHNHDHIRKRACADASPCTWGRTCDAGTVSLEDKRTSGVELSSISSSHIRMSSDNILSTFLMLVKIVTL